MSVPPAPPFVAAIAVVALALGVASCGGDDDAALVEHGESVADGGVELTLESVRYGGTGTVLRLSGSAEAGRVSVPADAISASGFADGSPNVLYTTSDGAAVRLPPVDTEATDHSLAVETVTLHSDGAESQEDGEWAFDLELPPADDIEDVLRTEELVLRAGEFPNEVSIVRSSAETLVTYQVPGDATPVLPPVMREEEDDGYYYDTGASGASYIGQLLPRWTRGESMQRFRATFPPTEFGSQVDLQMGLFADRDASPWTDTAVLVDHLDAVPTSGDTYDIEVENNPTDRSMEISRVLSREDGDAGGVIPGGDSENIRLRLDVALEGVRQWYAVAQEVQPVGFVLITDAKGLVMPIVGMRVIPGAGGQPGTTTVALRTDDDQDLSSVTITVAERGMEVYPPEPALLVPAGE